jgi:phosphate:Na+ symporter
LSVSHPRVHFFAMKVMSAMVPSHSASVRMLLFRSVTTLLGRSWRRPFPPAQFRATIAWLSRCPPGLMPLAAAVPVIFGANVGTCVTAFASSIGSHTEAKRVAMAHVFFKVVGVVLFFPFIAPFARGLR